MYSKRDRTAWSLVLFMLCGIVAGGFLGEYAGNFQYLSWLRYGAQFGLDQPFSVNLSILTLQFGIMIKLNVCGIIGMILAVFLHRRMM